MFVAVKAVAKADIIVCVYLSRTTHGILKIFELVKQLRSRCCIGSDKLFVGSRTRTLEVDIFDRQMDVFVYLL